MKIAETNQTIYTPFQKSPFFLNCSDRVVQLADYIYQRKIAEIR
jgi:hypothetical protein